ncbi:MAG: hypothetical protein EBY27_03840, partial [Synechococcaceae bacterium WB8_3_299]|nr:hypothetical protein [Synechococcaceae bacterium WB8_3_299]
MFFKKIIDLLTSLPFNLAGVNFPPEKFKYSEEKRKLDLIGNNSDIFNYYYINNFWGDSESVSGPGSTLAYTENLRAELPKLVEELEVTSILDSPCGDYNWFRMIDWNSEITYVGGDIVETLVSRNQLLFGSEKRNFVCLDIINDKLPDADIWLCRDCLFHLSNKDIHITHKYLWDLLQRPNILFEKGVNILIFENDSILCPFGENIKNFYDTSKDSIVIIKTGDKYEPIYYLQGNGKTAIHTCIFPPHKKEIVTIIDICKKECSSTYDINWINVLKDNINKYNINLDNIVISLGPDLQTVLNELLINIQNKKLNDGFLPSIQYLDSYNKVYA